MTSPFKLKIDLIFQDLSFFSKIGDRIWAAVLFFSRICQILGQFGIQNHRFYVFPLHNGIKTSKFSRAARAVLFFSKIGSRIWPGVFIFFKIGSKVWVGGF